MKTWMIVAVIYTVKLKPEKKFRSERDSIYRWSALPTKLSRHLGAINEQLLVGLIAQLVEHCISQRSKSNPAQT